jgi:hypothetical protein
VVGEMPTVRKPFTIEGSAERETFPEMERQRRESCRLAEWYFDDRERFSQEYLDQSILLAKDKVLTHWALGEQDTPVLFQMMNAEGVGMYETFVKLVRAEEYELREPYILNA